MPAAQILFLTSILRLTIETAEEGLAHTGFTVAQKMVLRAKINVARGWLAAQEAVNVELPKEAVEEALALHDRRMEALGHKTRPVGIRRPKARKPKHETRLHALSKPGSTESTNAGSEKSNTHTTPSKRGKRHAPA